MKKIAWQLFWSQHKRLICMLTAAALLAGIAVFLFLPKQPEPPGEMEVTCNADLDPWYFVPKPVDAVPEGFIPLAEAEKESAGILLYTFPMDGRTDLLLEDELGRTILSAPIYDGSLIVSVDGEYYVRAASHREALQEARTRSEELRQPYALQASIPLARYSWQSDLVVVSVTGGRIQAVRQNAHLDSHKLITYFLQAETRNGAVLTEFTEQEDGSLTVPLADGDEIVRLIVQNPEHPEITRTVLVQEKED